MSMLIVFNILTLLVCMSTSQKLCVADVTDEWPVSGEYIKSTTTMSNGYYYYTKTIATTPDDTTEVLLYVFEYGPLYTDSSHYSLVNNWYFTRGLVLEANPWAADDGLSTATTLGYCQTPNNIASPTECDKWWNLDTLTITEGDCPSTKAPTKAPTYEDVEIILLNEEQKNALVNEHNIYRGNLARGEVLDKNGEYLNKAAKMYPMVWDDTIAESARQWANKCQQDHDNDDQLYGENIAWSTEKVWETGVADWNSEHELYEYGLPMDSYYASRIGHFLNIIFEPLTRIGCAVATCPNCILDGRSMTCNWIICKYGAISDMITRPYTDPYETSSTTGSECDNGVDEAGLCVSGTE